MDLKDAAAYHGAGWQARAMTLADEIQRGEIWAPMTVNSEWAPLKAVMLFTPGREIENIGDPDQVQHLAPIEHARLDENLRSLRAIYEKHGVSVYDVSELILFPEVRQQFNLMYMRDAFFATAEGAVIARMASRVRAGEEKFTGAALATLGVPIRMTIGGSGTFEGADALWINPRTVLCGVGKRTNHSGFVQLKALLAAMDVQVHQVVVPDSIQHLLGIVQIVDRDLVFVRAEHASHALTAFFRANDYQVVEVPETQEIAERQAFNIVTLGPRKILMPSGCPEQKEFFLNHGVAEVEECHITELIKGAGGIACATGILSRETV